MRIDPAAEDLGREATRTAIAQDEDSFLAALKAITEADAELRDQVLPIYAAIGRDALVSVYKNGSPNQEQNLEMARLIAENESWAPIEVRDVWETLEGLSTEEHVPQIPVERIAPTLFIVVGYLLSSYTDSSGFATFYEYLDDILNRLVARPG